MTNEAFTVCKNASLKLSLFVGHQMRCKNQQRAMERIDEKMNNCFKYSNGNRVSVQMVIDFKIKFEPLPTRETNLEHYDKRGIGWYRNSRWKDCTCTLCKVHEISIFIY